MTKIASILLFCLFFVSAYSQQIETEEERVQYFPKVSEKVTKIPNKKNVWVFIMAGQSNMAGRGVIAAQDTIPNKRILTVNAKGELVLAKEPLHFYEPNRTGLDCGMSFSKTLLQHIPKNITILILPTAVGGSAMQQWLSDSTYRGVNLLSNFKEKVAIGQKYGTIKAVLWHQGESDATEKNIGLYSQRLPELFKIFRASVNNNTLPILMGELGSYSKTDKNWQIINSKIRDYVRNDGYSALIATQDLKHKGDDVHFNAEGQRTIGQRFAEKYLEKIGKL